MTISQLISTLQGVEDQYGDVEVERTDGTSVNGVSCVFEEGGKYNVTEGEFPPVIAVNVV